MVDVCTMKVSSSGRNEDRGVQEQGETSEAAGGDGKEMRTSTAAKSNGVVVRHWWEVVERKKKKIGKIKD